MTLTSVGRALAVETRRALDYLSQAYAVAHVETAPLLETLNLAAQVGLIEHWLLPRLAEFRAALDGAGVRISSLSDLSEKCPEDADIALVYAKSRFPLFRNLLSPALNHGVVDSEIRYSSCQLGGRSHQARRQLTI